ncbi:MAG TPA: hypothetical protein VNK95_05400, partial [Caldilineaceae bacterium]|nr:hypothetical protein [Caldilineaceae bacterium]
REQTELMLPLVDDAAWETYPALGADWEANLTQEQADAINAFWGTAGTGAAGDDLQPTEVQPIQAPEPGQAVRARALLDTSVTAADGTTLGQTQNLLIDLSAHRFKYVVVALAAGAAQEPGSVLLPYSLFAPGDQQLALNADFNTGLLETAPRVDATALAEADILDAGWDDESAAYWREAGLEVPEPE